VSTWSQLRGDTSRFAFSVTFEPDPDPGFHEDEAYSASWGAIELWADGVNLCAHREAGETVERVHWYLLPLLQWLVDSWDPLLHEERLPLRNLAATAAGALRGWLPEPLVGGLDDARALRDLESWQQWRGRHGLVAASRGGLFPAAYLRRWGDLIEVSWDNATWAGIEDYRFLSTSGSARLPASEVAGALAGVLNGAVGHLVERVPASSSLEELLARITALRDPGRAEQRRLWLGGAGRERVRHLFEVADRILYGAAEATREALLGTGTNALVVEATPQLAVLFGSAAPALSDHDVVTLTEKMLATYGEHEVVHEDLDELAQELEQAGSASAQDYEQGNALAAEVLARLALDQEKVIDVAGVMDNLGIRRDDVKLDDRGTRAVSVLGPDQRPAVFINANFRWGASKRIRRTSLAHELCHLLVDRGRAVRLAVMSGPWAPVDIERRAGAFAAALLMPPQLVRRAMRHSFAPEGTIEWLREIADAAETSALSTLDRLWSLGVVDDLERDDLRAQLLAPSVSERELRFYADLETYAAVVSALEQASNGDLYDLGSFHEYLDDER
jgi:Zn-dependent peptidase ImmA (M78 family)